LSTPDRRSDFSIETVPTRIGCPVLVALEDVVGDGVPLLVLALVDQVVQVQAHVRAVGRDLDHSDLVGPLELGQLGLGRPRHARELVVHLEVVLDRDRGERLVLFLDLHALFGLDRLVQAFGVAPAPRAPAP
jgi:hypothetical protein